VLFGFGCALLILGAGAAFPMWTVLRDSSSGVSSHPFTEGPLWRLLGEFSSLARDAFAAGQPWRRVVAGLLQFYLIDLWQLMTLVIFAIGVGWEVYWLSRPQPINLNPSQPWARRRDVTP
jgi:hypothetical protein